MKGLFPLVILGSSLSHVSADSPRCRALALSGGGAKGAYQAGVLWGLFHRSEQKQEFSYDVITGVSAGAINTLALGLFHPSETEEALEFLSKQWEDLDDAKVYKRWPGGVAEGLSKKSGIFNN